VLQLNLQSITPLLLLLLLLLLLRFICCRSTS
jgi:hypothetical protein